MISFAETGDAVPVNVATQGTRAYFISETAIPESGTNPNGAEPKPGARNLYLSEEGQARFVATVTDRDVEGEGTGGGLFDGLGLWTEALALRQPARDPSRVTPDGAVMLFQSRADLAAGANHGVSQVYRYDSVGGSLRCVSCPPVGVPPVAGADLQSMAFGLAEPIPFGPSAFVPDITPDGRRAFFESTESLVATDTDGVRDVYEWEEQGIGSCERPAGCVYLISSGHSARDNYLYGHSTSGDDVFFTTADVLLSSDNGGTLSIYDARVNGGFPVAGDGGDCSGEGCKPPLALPPSLPEPESGARSISGNVKPGKRCPKGKRKAKRQGKVRCVKKKHRHRRGSTKKKGAAR